MPPPECPYRAVEPTPIPGEWLEIQGIRRARQATRGGLRNLLNAFLLRISGRHADSHCDVRRWEPEERVKLERGRALPDSFEEGLQTMHDRGGHHPVCALLQHVLTAWENAQRWIDAERCDDEALEVAMLALLRAYDCSYAGGAVRGFHDICDAVGRWPSIREIPHDGAPDVLARSLDAYMNTGRKPQFARAPILQHVWRWDAEAEPMLFVLNDHFLCRAAVRQFPGGPRQIHASADAGLTYARAHNLALQHWAEGGREIAKALPQIVGAQFWIRTDRGSIGLPEVQSLLAQRIAALQTSTISSRSQA